MFDPLTPLALATLPVVGMPVDAGDEWPLVARVRAGATVTGRAELLVELEEREVAFTVDGEPGTDHDKKLAVRHVEAVTWTDRIADVAEGRVTGWTRAFDEIDGAMSFEEVGRPMPEREGTSPLAGRVVAYEWSPEEARFDRAFDDRAEVSADDEARLDGLTGLVDLAAFLPDAPVAVGAEWSVEADGMGAGLVPLGVLDIDRHGQELIGLGTYTGFTAPALPPTPGRWWGAPRFDGFEDDVTVRLARVGRVEGRTIATLEVTARVFVRSSLADWLEAFELTSQELEVDRMVVESRVAGTGELRWDVERGAAVAWEFEGEVDLRLDAAWSLTQRNRYELLSTRSLEGSVASTISLEHGR